ncbi:MAG: hypothetical protein ACI91B_001454 [Planctomycetota bacterium]|jgi:hypothetical protein
MKRPQPVGITDCFALADVTSHNGVIDRLAAVSSIVRAMSASIAVLKSPIAATLLGLVLAGATCSHAHAQAGGSAWADLFVSQGVVSTAVRGQGKLVTYDQGSTLHVFSAVTRRWHATPKSPSATVRLLNDCAIIFEPNLYRAFSSHTGRFVDLNTTGSSSILNSASHKNDSIILVTNGTELHAFSAFTGTWTSRAIAPGYAADVQRHVAVVHQGTTVAALSAFDNIWREHDCGTMATAISADGTAAIASNAATTFAFSAHTRTWQMHEPLGNATFTRADDWALWFNGSAVVAYSSLRGAFASELAEVTTLAGSSDLYALLNTSTGLLAFSAVTGDLLAIAQPATSVELGSAVALLHRSKSVRAYSPLRQTVAMLQVKTIASDAGSSVAFVTEANGQTHAFSSFTSSWVAAPAVTAGFPATMSTTTVALQSANDCHAFAARSGQFIALGYPVQALASNPTSAPLLGYDASNLAAFDTDSERWLSRPRSGTAAPVFAIWRTSALAVDGPQAHGFGAQTGAWQSHPLAPGSTNVAANSEVAYATQANQIAACSMLPEIVSYQQFPHFRRVQPRGTTISFAAAPPAAAFAFAALAPPITPLLVPGLGALMLDANVAMIAPVMPTANAPVVQLSWQLPAAAILAGTTLASQLLVLPSTGSAYLSNRASVQLW